MTIVADTSARHDCLCGCTVRRTNGRRYGDGDACQRRASERPRPARARRRQARPRTRATSAPCVNLFKSAPGRRRRRARARRRRRAGDLRRAARRDRRAGDVANTPAPARRAGRLHVEHRALLRLACDAARPTADPFARPRPSGSEPSRTPRLLSAGAPMTASSLDEVIPGPGAVVARRCRRGRDAADRRPRRQPGRRLPAVQRRRPGERYSAADTIAAQRNIFLVAGTPLLSNEGAPMMTITATTCAYHDTIGGACSRESNTLRYGHHTATSTPASTTSSTRACATASPSATSCRTSTGS